ncbi:arsenite S-adenosylmethyltransferase [Halobacteriales archaeon QS_1_68_17]|nr:MAG: arsenite S-adenosylmethyltransferase [Halobacteriales archaeon QS_1_68_17]
MGDDPPDAADQRRAVRDRYAAIAAGEDGDCCGDACCDDPGTDATRLGYSPADLDAAGEANLGLGCGNPGAIADLDPGESVLDLGSGAGFDCLLAARAVGDAGRVIGVDMTPEMVERARGNAADWDNVEFRLGEFAHLPVRTATVDVVVSNCAINLAPDKPRVFREAYRVLRPGGRLAVSDVVLTAPVPEDLRGDPGALADCVAGAAPIGDIEAMLTAAGFVNVAVEPRADGAAIVDEWDRARDLGDFLVSARIAGRKPADAGA